MKKTAITLCAAMLCSVMSVCAQPTGLVPVTCPAQNAPCEKDSPATADSQNARNVMNKKPPCSTHAKKFRRGKINTSKKDAKSTQNSDSHKNRE